MPKNASSHTGGHFELTIDGAPSSAYVRHVEGGHIKQEVISEQAGPDRLRIKHNSVAEIEPFSFEVGMSGTGDILRWIRESWRGKYQQRNGQITHADFNLNRTLVHEFREALIQETTFPELDGKSNQPAYMKMKMLAAHVKTEARAADVPLTSSMSTKQKLWTPSSFRFSIDGIDGLDHVNKVEAFTIKQNVKMMHTGADRFPELVPTNIEFPSLKGTMSMAYGAGLAAWHQEYVVSGRNDADNQRTGLIEYLAPNKRDVIFAIQLYDVGITRLAIEKVTANQAEVKRYQFELYVGRMDILGSHMGIA